MQHAGLLRTTFHCAPRIEGSQPAHTTTGTPKMTTVRTPANVLLATSSQNANSIAHSAGQFHASSLGLDPPSPDPRKVGPPEASAEYSRLK
jgi:hypothetical protein